MEENTLLLHTGIDIVVEVFTSVKALFHYRESQAILAFKRENLDEGKDC